MLSSAFFTSNTVIDGTLQAPLVNLFVLCWNWLDHQHHHMAHDTMACDHSMLVNLFPHPSLWLTGCARKNSTCESATPQRIPAHCWVDLHHAAAASPLSSASLGVYSAVLDRCVFHHLCGPHRLHIQGEASGQQTAQSTVNFQHCSLCNFDLWRCSTAMQSFDFHLMCRSMRLRSIHHERM